MSSGESTTPVREPLPPIAEEGEERGAEAESKEDLSEERPTAPSTPAATSSLVSELETSAEAKEGLLSQIVSPFKQLLASPDTTETLTTLDDLAIPAPVTAPVTPITTTKPAPKPSTPAAETVAVTTPAATSTSIIHTGWARLPPRRRAPRAPVTTTVPPPLVIMPRPAPEYVETLPDLRVVPGEVFVDSDGNEFLVPTDPNTAIRIV